MRLRMFMTFFRLTVPMMLVMALVSAVEFLREPSFCCGSWCFILSLVAAFDRIVADRQLPCTLQFLHNMRFFFVIANLAATFSNGWASKDDFLGRIGIVIGAQTLHGILFPADGMTVVNSVLHTVLYIWATAQVHGQSSLNLWLFTFHMAFQILVCNVFPFVLEFTLRDCVTASFQSKDSDSLISGFRQMLKGICDGELLVDGKFRICGGAPCLQRLLASQEEFAGRCLRDLIDGDEAREKIDGFLVPAVQGDDAEDLRPNEGAPRCLRVPLKAPSGQVVPVDVFHVPLPRSLYGESTNYHLHPGCAL